MKSIPLMDSVRSRVKDTVEEQGLIYTNSTNNPWNILEVEDLGFKKLWSEQELM